MDIKKLSDSELERYHRQIILPDFGEAAQLKLKQARILIIGAGGLASPILKYLCSTGIGCIGLMDGDRVEESNLQRQIMYDQSDKGKFKVEVSAQKLKEQNPNIKVDQFNFRLTGENAKELFQEYDLIIDACDNFETRYIICKAAQKRISLGCMHLYLNMADRFLSSIIRAKLNTQIYIPKLLSKFPYLMEKP